MVRKNICNCGQWLIKRESAFTHQNKHDQSQLCHRDLHIRAAVHCDSLPLGQPAVELLRIRRLLKLCMFYQLDYGIFGTDIFRFGGSRSSRRGDFDIDEEIHYPTRPVDKEKAENELVINIKKATSPEESAPKQKHVRSLSKPVYTFQNANDPNQNVSFILGIIILQYLSGMVCGCNLFWRTKFRLSKLSSLYTRSYRKAIRWYVILEGCELLTYPR